MSGTDIARETAVSTQTEPTPQAETTTEPEATTEAEATTEPKATTEAETTTEADTTVEADATTPTEPAATETEAAPRTARTRRVVPIALAVLVLAAAVGTALLGWRVYGEAQAQRDRDAALEAARTGTAEVLSYDSKTLDADLARARAAISGGFAAKFDEVTNAVIVPAAHQRSLSAKATVVRAALLDADLGTRPDQVQALVFVNQATTVGTEPQPRAVSNQVKVTMTRTNGKWLITDLQPL